MENKHGYQSGRWGGINWEFGINRNELSYIKHVNNKDLLYSPGNYTQYIIITNNGKEFLKRI